MKHTCDTARSGSERNENTCAACHDERARRLEQGGYPVQVGYGDITAEWERMTASIGRKDAKTGGRS